MKLAPKVSSAFIIVILIFAAATFFTVSFILNNRIENNIETVDLPYAQKISDNIFKQLINQDNLSLANTLFDEKNKDKEKIEYMMVFDEKGYLISHTYLSLMPKNLISLGENYNFEEDYSITKIKNKDLFVYNIAVPVFEGIKPIGTLHLGLNGNHLFQIKNYIMEYLTIATAIIIILSIIIALMLTKLIVTPIKKLTKIADQVTSGNYKIRIPHTSKDEIGELAAAIEMLVASLKFKNKK